MSVDVRTCPPFLCLVTRGSASWSSRARSFSPSGTYEERMFVIVASPSRSSTYPYCLGVRLWCLHSWIGFVAWAAAWSLVLLGVPEGWLFESSSWT